MKFVGSAEPVNHAEFVHDFRRKLMEAHAHWERVASQHQGDRDAEGIRTYGAALMAGSYAYTLAAVLGHAVNVSADVAAELAGVADEILTDGDPDRLNADVTSPASPELPDYITLDPEQGSCGEKPGAHWHCPAHRHSGTWVSQDDNAACARADAARHLNALHPGWDAS